jgi:hypothetical protein
MFDAPLPPSDHALMQDRSFAAALLMCGEHPVTLPWGLTLLNRRVAGVPVLMLPRAAPPPDLGAQLAREGLHRRLLILSPEQPAPMPRSLRVASPRTLLHVDLRRAPSKLAPPVGTGAARRHARPSPRPHARSPPPHA